MKKIYLKSNLFFGTDTYGVHYEVAIKNNEFYHRSYKNNGYGMSFSKWEKINDFGGIFYIDDQGKERLKWGFGIDAKGIINNRIKIKN